jgi:hypothetical protein
MGWKTLGLVLLAWLFLPAVSAAQSNEFAVTFGIAFSASETGVPVCEAVPTCPLSGPVTVDPGFTVGGTYARRLVDFKAASLHLELPLMAAPSRSQPHIIATDNFSSLYFTPSLKVKFAPGAGISPFVSAGSGLAYYSGTAGKTTWAAQLGGGLDFKTPLPHLGVRVEARDFITGRPAISSLSNITSSHLQQVFVGGGLVIKF